MRRKSTKNRKMSKEDIIFHIGIYIIFGVVGLICIYPFYYLMICTISDNTLVEAGSITLFPVGVHFKNYARILKVENLSSAALVTVLRTVLGTVASVIATSYLAYFFTRPEMMFRKFWYRLVIATMYFSAGMLPIYMNNKMLGLVNTFWVYIIPGLISVYNMILVKTSIEAMPPDLEESAYLDGAGYLRRFISIVIPLQKPIIATIGLTTAVGHWNDFFTTNLYITNPKLFTLQFILYDLLKKVATLSAQITADNPYEKASITPTGIRLTLTAVMTIPIILIYPMIQKYFVKGIMVGAVKG